MILVLLLLRFTPLRCFDAGHTSICIMFPARSCSYVEWSLFTCVWIGQVEWISGSCQPLVALMRLCLPIFFGAAAWSEVVAVGQTLRSISSHADLHLNVLVTLTLSPSMYIQLRHRPRQEVWIELDHWYCSWRLFNWDRQIEPRSLAHRRVLHWPVLHAALAPLAGALPLAPPLG